MTPDPNEKRRAYFREYRRKWREANREKYLELNKQVTVKKHATLKRIAELEAEVERLRASSFVTAVPVEEYEKLKAEVERLRQAGDWMYNAVILNSELEMDKAMTAWNAAKEGKQS